LDAEQIEVDITNGLERLTVVGLPSAAVRQIDLSARAIADLASEEDIDTPHLAEALQYRPRQLA
jgi:predicted ATPase with chaperone activity